MTEMEMLKIEETEADWMIYSEPEEKRLFSPTLKFIPELCNQLECTFWYYPQKKKKNINSCLVSLGSPCVMILMEVPGTS